MSTSTSNENKSKPQNTGTMIPRYNGPPINKMTTEQKSLYEQITKSRPNTGISGPFGPWLAIPSIAHPSQALGLACRYGTSLSMRESELVILLTGAKMKSKTEFEIHVVRNDLKYFSWVDRKSNHLFHECCVHLVHFILHWMQGEALRAGLTQEIIESIPRNNTSSSTENFSLDKVKTNVLPLLLQSDTTPDNHQYKREEATVLFTAELLDTCTVSDETYKSTKDTLGGLDSSLVEITSIIGYYTYVAFTLNVFQIPSNRS